MAVQPQLWTLHGLSVELQIYREKLARDLIGLAPDQEDGKAGKRWTMARVVKHLNESGDHAKLDRTQEDARLKKAQADLKELDLAMRRGELASAVDVGNAVTSVLMALRSRLLALPKRMAPVVAGLKKPAEIQAKLEKDVHQALAELAQMDPDEILKTLRKRYATAPDGDGQEAQP
jgi:phage terminase Nu1 subunit (DNA packaging protein)